MDEKAAEKAEFEFWQQYQCDRSRTLDGKGLSTVYEARHIATGELWAIKTVEIHKNFDYNGFWANTWERAKNLQHIYLLPIKQIHEWKDGDWKRYALLLPLVEAGSAEGENPAENWNESQRYEFWEATAQAIQFLHNQNLVHQQLAPSHILCKKAAGFIFPLLIQYGCAEVLPLAFIKNHETLAPEQFDNQEFADKRTDVWALGILAYWLWLGKYPFGQKSTLLNNNKLKNNILRDEIPELLNQLPPLMQKIVSRCLQKDKNERWASVSELLEFYKKEQERISENANVVAENQAIAAITSSEIVAIENRPPRNFRRRPSRPINWFWVLILIGAAAVFGYWLNKF